MKVVPDLKQELKRFNKESKAPPAKHLGDRVHFYLCTMKYKAYGGIKNWLLIQDEYTKFIWSKFLNAEIRSPSNNVGLDNRRGEKG